MAGLALGVFSFVTTETLPIGLLPSIADGTSVSVGAAGFLVTGFATVAAVTAAPLTTLTGRMDRRWLLATLMGFYIAGNLLATLTSTYPLLLAARIIVALAHGVFWSIAVSIAVRLVPERHAVRATSVVLGGISLASVAGTPLGTAIGQSTSWQVAFACVGLLGVPVLAAALLFMPALPAQGSGNLRTILHVLRRRTLLAAIGVTALVMSGHFLAFTYVTPYLEEVTGVRSSLIGVLLLVFGAAGLVGNFAAGAVAARALRNSLIGSSGLLAAVLAAMWAGGASTPLAVTMLVCWGVLYAALPVALQTWVLQAVPEESEAASSWYVAAFNGAIGVGSLIGGLLTNAWGPRSTMLAAAVFAAGATALAVACGRDGAQGRD
ncbi:MFS transporter [Streptomyces somaliensis DSM 40738]|uniref:MFS transporter n=1 Tax=Streptomyces somaliensis (strain ATCC 33201 / DSM 40738 / JCM 12659 / KCTC 9044 / NCTC 11332 / NRRL B-12077 / IP 733) TaxID=1134445 RepID=A0AA44DBG3_STRE0|nr:MFS transporter [Streptomyces somaliensis]MCQ0025184.1 MFS transporter [Streptomyces somaliensis DSM 40738]NKY13383.1 MFS transporter [Streptomyces somaliensis DSM 40738]